MLVARDRVLAGVSGGADSVCLLLVLKELEYNVAVAHVNHGLRGVESDEDEEFTRQLAERLGVKFFEKRVSLMGPSPGAFIRRDLRSFPSRRPLPGGEANMEAAGRAARKEFFAELVREHGFTKIAVAHTRNDRVETFLMNLLRGSGTDGLISMAPVTGDTVRPLIESTRQDIETYLEDQNQAWRTDSTNLDLGFARNRLRHVVIPTLASEFNPNLIETLARTVEILTNEDKWVRTLTDQWLSENGAREDDTFVIRSEKLKSQPLGLARRVIRSGLRQLGSELRDVSFEHIEAVRRLLEPGKSGKFVEIPGGLEVAREFDRLVFRRAAAARPCYEYELRIPGHVRIPELGKIFRAEIIEEKRNLPDAERVFVDAGSIGPCVRIRNWMPGDYYKPVGLPAGKLKKLFQRAQIPRSHRIGWPVVVADSTIVWVASFPVSREFAPSGNSQRIVAIEALPF